MRPAGVQSGTGAQKLTEVMLLTESGGDGAAGEGGGARWISTYICRVWCRLWLRF